MAVKAVRRYLIACDECPDENITFPEAETVSEALGLALEDNWAIEQSLFAGRRIDVHICADCLRRREEAVCGAREQGHRWSRDHPDHYHVDSDGWCHIEPEMRWRSCLDCPRREYAGEAFHD